jgi:Na+/H+ antiporter NhaC
MPLARLIALLILLALILMPARGQETTDPAGDIAPGVANDANADYEEVEVADAGYEIEAPRLVLKETGFTVTVAGPVTAADADALRLRVGGREWSLQYDEDDGVLRSESMHLSEGGAARIELVRGGQVIAEAGTRAIPGWLSLLPPLLAIALALIFKEVVISLFAGVWLGALIVAGFNPIEATMRSIDRYVVDALSDPYHISVIVFSLMLGGMVGVVTRSGGARGVVEALLPLATSRRRGQIIAWFSGLFIFFDDYANTLIRGNALRPLTDRLRISREKLAYIVDSVAAPIAVIAVISTWVGFEISMIATSLEVAAGQAADATTADQLLAGAGNAFLVFLHSIPYLFYPFLAITFVLMIALTDREFGTMHGAEVRALTGGGVFRPGAMLAGDTESAALDPPDGAPHRWYNLVVPVMVVIAIALGGLFYTGMQELEPGERSLRDIIGNADPFASLLWASFAGVVVAMIMAISQRILTAVEAINAWVGGMRAMLLAIVILSLAWALSGITEEVGTGVFLAGALEETLPMGLLPTIVFLIAAATAFATGTAWGTMAILFPVVVPLAATMGAGIGMAGGEHYPVMLGSIASIMAGAVFGDHASPISDTTVISSMSSGCDHIDHVRTQLPYALVAAGVAIVLGTLPAGFGVSPLILLPVGMLALFVIIRVFGHPVDESVRAAKAARKAR